jgi:hypothetical protein
MTNERTRDSEAGMIVSILTSVDVAAIKQDHLTFVEYFFSGRC